MRPALIVIISAATLIVLFFALSSSSPVTQSSSKSSSATSNIHHQNESSLFSWIVSGSWFDVSTGEVDDDKDEEMQVETFNYEHRRREPLLPELISSLVAEFNSSSSSASSDFLQFLSQQTQRHGDICSNGSKINPHFPAAASLPARCRRYCDVTAPGVQFNETKLCANILSDCVAALTRSCDTSQNAILKPLLADVATQLLRGRRSSSKIALEQRCDRWLNDTCIGRNPVNGRVKPYFRRRKGSCLLWSVDGHGESSISVLKSSSTHVASSNNAKEQRKRFTREDEFVVQSVLGAFQEKEHVLKAAARTLLAHSHSLLGGRSSSSSRRMEAVFFLDEERFQCEPPPENWHCGPSRQHSCHQHSNETVLRFSRGTQRDGVPAILLPPIQLLRQGVPRLQRKLSASRSESSIKAALQSAVDRSGKCGLVAWHHRAPLAGVYCGTEMEPLNPVALHLRHHIGFVQPPASLMLAAEAASAASSQKQSKSVIVSESRVAAGDYTDDRDERNNQQQPALFQQHSLGGPKMALLAFGSGFKNVNADRRIPVDWCDGAQLCSESAADRAAPWAGGRSGAGGGFSLSKTKLAAHLHQEWGMSEGARAVAVAAGGAAPVLVSSHRWVKRRPMEREALIMRQMSVFDVVVGGGSGGSGGGAWSTHVPWVISDFPEGAADDLSPEEEAELNRRERLRQDKEQRPGFRRKIWSGASRRSVEHDQQAKSEHARVLEKRKKQASAADAAGSGQDGGAAAVIEGTTFVAEVLEAGASLEKLLLRGSEFDRALETIASNHRSIVRALRGASQVQDAYLGAILLLTLVGQNNNVV